MASILTDNLKEIYPLPQLVQARPTTAIGEVRRTNAPSVLAELGYHDNIEDAMWIENSLEPIARALVLSITEYFGVPFVLPDEPRSGTVSVQSGRLNIRDLPTTASSVLAQAANGDTLTVYGANGDWYSVGYRGIVGYANRAFVTV